MAPKQVLHCENYSFMTCLLWVDTSSFGWQKDVQKVLQNIQGVTTFRMHGVGIIEISGTMNAQKLMKKLGKKLAIIWFQFGDCSTNLFMRSTDPYDSGCGYGGGQGLYGGGGGGSDDGRFLHFDDVGSHINNSLLFNNPMQQVNHHRTDHDGHYCSAGGNAKVTRCRVADEAKTAAVEPSAPPLPPNGGGGISSCCLM